MQRRYISYVYYIYDYHLVILAVYARRFALLFFYYILISYILQGFDW